MNKTCICVCSCDAYSDIWPIFFRFLKDAWADCPYPIFLNTETKSYSDEYFQVSIVNSDAAEETWSQRLMRCLQKLDYQNIIIILDDFFLLNKVDTAELEWCEQKLQENPNIACFSFRNNPYQNEGHVFFRNYIRRNVNETYIVNLLPGIWNKKALLRILSPYENAWQFEWFGTERARMSTYLFYELKKDEKPIFKFNIAPSDGYGLCQGKWTRKNEELFKERGIEVDFSIRGFCNPDKINTTVTVPKRTLRDRITYFIYGGLPYGVYKNGKRRMSFCTQIGILLRHPRFYYFMIKRKMRYLLNKDMGNIIDTRY